MGIKFGSFDSVCQQAALVVCPLVGSSQGIEPTCYSRNVQVGGTLIFQPAACFIHIVAIIMTIIMILHIRSKYTAVGRKEIVLFFYIYAVIQLLGIFLDSAVIPTASGVYPWFTAAYAGLCAAAYMCLLINAFIGFQFAEDGTPLSLWGLRAACTIMFGVTFFVAIGTFQSKFGMSPEHPTVLWIIYLLWPLICVVVYIVLQLVLVLRTLDDRWPIGDIVFGTGFFAIGQVILLAFSNMICDAVKHYIDGLFLFELCMLLSVMMVYKYWDSITKEDLEFSVGSKVAVWEVKDPLLAGYGNAGMASGSGYGNGAGSSNQGGYSRAAGGNEYYDDGSQYGGQYGGGGKAGSLVGGVSGNQLYGPGGGGAKQHGYPPQGY